MIEFRRNKETGLLEAIKDGEYVGVIYTMGDFISEEPVNSSHLSKKEELDA